MTHKKTEQNTNIYKNNYIYIYIFFNCDFKQVFMQKKSIEESIDLSASNETFVT